MEKRIKDHMGRTLRYQYPPRRILSLVPSITELIFDLGLEERIVGRTKFCTHPQDKVDAVPKVGGTKALKLDVIAQLKPDLILANQEENQKPQILKLAHRFPVWVSDIRTFDDAVGMIAEIGRLTGTEEEGESLSAEIRARFDRIPALDSTLSVVYLIWKNPLMAVGNDTFIHAMLEKLGFDNALSHTSRYPVLEAANLRDLKPDLVFLSSEPFPFRNSHLQELTPLFPNAGFHFVDGRYFSWYGSAMLKAALYFSSLMEKMNTANAR